MSREEIADRLHSFVERTVRDVRFRRRLRYEPAATLADCGFPAEEAPERLPVHHWAVSARFDSRHLFGPPPRRRTDAPPLEARLVAYGAKPMALALGTEDQLAPTRQWGEEHGLLGLLSPIEFDTETGVGKGGYSNRAARPRPARAGSGAERFLVLAPDENQALLGWLSLLFGWDDFLGALLGYPTCCVDAYRERWPEASARFDGDVAALLARSGSGGSFPWGVNVFGRYLGAELIHHFPCDLSCGESERLARRSLQALALAEPELARSLEQRLARLTLFTDRDGIFLLTDPDCVVDGGRMTVSATRGTITLTTDDSALAAALVRGDTVTVDTAAGRITASGSETAGHLLDFRAAWCGSRGSSPLGPVTVTGQATGLVRPQPGGTLLEACRLATTERLSDGISRLLDGIGDSENGLRGRAGFVARLASFWRGVAPIDRPAVIPLGLGGLAVAASGSDESRFASAVRLAGCAVNAPLPGRRHWVLPVHTQPGHGVYLSHLHARLIGQSGPVAIESESYGSLVRLTWSTGRALTLGSGSIQDGGDRLIGGRWIGDWPLLGDVTPELCLTEGQDEAIRHLARGRRLLARRWPAAFSRLQRWTEGLALVSPGDPLPFTPDILLVEAEGAGSAFGAALGLLVAAARARTACVWPILLQPGVDLAESWRAGGRSRLAALLARLDGWRLALRFVAADPLDDGVKEALRAIEHAAEDPLGVASEAAEEIAGSALAPVLEQEVLAEIASLTRATERQLRPATGDPTAPRPPRARPAAGAVESREGAAAVALRAKPDLESPPADLEELERGLGLWQAGELDQAESLFTTLSGRAPQDPRAWEGLGCVLWSQRRLAAALDAYQASLRLAPWSPGPWANTGLCQRDLGNKVEALSALRVATWLDPTYPQAWSELGNVLVDVGETTQAEPHYYRAIALDPSRPVYHHNLGVCLLRQGRVNEALLFFSKALALDPDYHHSLEEVERLLHEKGGPVHFRSGDEPPLPARRGAEMAEQPDPRSGDESQAGRARADAGHQGQSGLTGETRQPSVAGEPVAVGVDQETCRGAPESCEERGHHRRRLAEQAAGHEEHELEGPLSSPAANVEQVAAAEYRATVGEEMPRVLHPEGFAVDSDRPNEPIPALEPSQERAIAAAEIENPSAAPVED